MLPEMGAYLRNGCANFNEETEAAERRDEFRVDFKRPGHGISDRLTIREALGYVTVEDQNWSLLPLNADEGSKWDWNVSQYVQRLSLQ